MNLLPGLHCSAKEYCSAKESSSPLCPWLLPHIRCDFLSDSLPQHNSIMLSRTRGYREVATPKYPSHSDAQISSNYSIDTTSPSRRRLLDVEIQFPSTSIPRISRKMAPDPHPARRHRISAWHEKNAMPPFGTVSPKLFRAYDKCKVGTNPPCVKFCPARDLAVASRIEAKMKMLIKREWP